jgi:hypothetical protein
LAGLVSFLLALVAHYSPWNRLLGRPLPRLAAYGLGALSIGLPLTGLYILSASRSILPVLAVWLTIGGAGIATIGATLVDSWLSARDRAEVAEAEVAQLKEFLEGRTCDEADSTPGSKPTGKQ